MQGYRVNINVKTNLKRLLLGGCLLLSFLVSSASLAGTTLYHIVSEQELATFTKDNVYTPLSVAKEGYIHFSKLELIPYYANELYKDTDTKKLFLLKVTFSDDDKNLKWIGDNPDYYIGLDLSMVEQKTQFIKDHNNQWVLPN
ncbi:MAG: DUF952 domain-containing protein [Paraglaciecola sp.]|uniref:DUF952 domain-containing protein n=1 Tax=Paraglaciecola sp. TaxID=1920173 RepID=UPI003264BEE5